MSFIVKFLPHIPRTLHAPYKALMVSSEERLDATSSSKGWCLVFFTSEGPSTYLINSNLLIKFVFNTCANVKFTKVNTTASIHQEGGGVYYLSMGQI